MPWQEVTQVEQRKRFIELALLPGSNIASLCRKIGISRKTGYKWISRYQAGNLSTLLDKSRRPKFSPNQVKPSMEALILEVRDQFPDWGGRKLRSFLLEHGHSSLPSVSTITEILRRNNRLSAKHSSPTYCNFEHEQPNDLWQMDFKGNFPLSADQRCHPLTIIDDHSRFSICLQAFDNEQKETVKKQLIACFKQYGMPIRINTDNGSPWGSSSLDDPTHLAIWLMRLGIELSHSRPYHPQTNGKLERFHRTLKLELLSRKSLTKLHEAQKAFDEWRHVYNYVRPHESARLKPPAQRYQPSNKTYPDKLPPIEYGDEQVRKVDKSGKLSFCNRQFKIGKGLAGEYLAVKETDVTGVYSVFFINNLIKKIDLKVSDNQ